MLPVRSVDRINVRRGRSYTRGRVQCGSVPQRAFIQMTITPHDAPIDELNWAGTTPLV